MSRDATQYRARHDAALAAELKARRAAEPRACTFCNRVRIVADCGGRDCEARCCDAPECWDAEMAMCIECADSQRAEDAREAKQRAALAEIILSGALIGGMGELL